MMQKQQQVGFYCTNCGQNYPKWQGKCAICNQWSTIVEEEKAQYFSQETELVSRHLSEIGEAELTRTTSGFLELDRVLGSSLDGKSAGFTKGQVILIAGSPGVGKSTLLLQLGFNLVKQSKRCIYVSGEESEGQIAARAYRILGAKNLTDDEKFEIISGHNIEAILSKIESRKMKDEIVVIDSIQTVYSSVAKSVAGTVSQIRLCASKLIDFAKISGNVLLMVGHVTKEGAIAGPMVLEHMVDTVIQFEGEEKTGFRLLRSLKNRYGPTGEIGIFMMAPNGLNEVVDPYSLVNLANEAGGAVGVCKGVIFEGSRGFIVEVQALVSSSAFSLPKRVSEGFSLSRLQRIVAILNKYGYAKLFDKDIYVKIAAGVKSEDPGLDLAIAMSILSSAQDKPVDNKILAFGELNLTGRVGQVMHEEVRRKEAKRLGPTIIIDSQKCPTVYELKKYLK